MSNKLIKKKDRIITMTEQEYADMKRKMTQEIKLEIFDELQRKVTSMQAQALMLSFGLALYERCNFNEDEITSLYVQMKKWQISGRWMIWKNSETM